MPGKASRSRVLWRNPDRTHRSRPPVNRRRVCPPTCRAAVPTRRLRRPVAKPRRSPPKRPLPSLPGNPLRSRPRNLPRSRLWNLPRSRLRSPLKKLRWMSLLRRTKSITPPRPPEAPRLCEALLRCFRTIPRSTRATPRRTRSSHGLTRAWSTCCPAPPRIPAGRTGCRSRSMRIRTRTSRSAGSMRMTRVR